MKSTTYSFKFAVYLLIIGSLFGCKEDANTPSADSMMGGSSIQVKISTLEERPQEVKSLQSVRAVIPKRGLPNVV